MQPERWVQRIKEAGWEPVAIPLLEVARALGFVVAQALLIGQPLLVGLVDEAWLQKAVAWFSDPQGPEQALERLREGQ